MSEPRYYNEATGDATEEAFTLVATGSIYHGASELARLERERDAALRTVAGLERMAKDAEEMPEWHPCRCADCIASGVSRMWTNPDPDEGKYPTLASAVAAWVEANPEQEDDHGPR